MEDGAQVCLSVRGYGGELRLAINLWISNVDLLLESSGLLNLFVIPSICCCRALYASHIVTKVNGFVLYAIMYDLLACYSKIFYLLVYLDC